MSYTKEQLRSEGAPHLAEWLVHAALNRTDITYGEAKRRLEIAWDKGTIFSTHMGEVADAVMERLYEVDEDIPLLNVLLVQQGNGMPGDGIRSYFLEASADDRFKKKKARKKHPKLWKRQSRESAKAVYTYEGWEPLFAKAFDQELPSADQGFLGEIADEPVTGNGRGGGESDEHKALRLWVMNNPDILFPGHNVMRAETEVLLMSGDRVDAVFYGDDFTCVIEVKSRRSNDNDHQRGLYQCVKYRAVQEAMSRLDALPVRSLLVTENELTSDHKATAKALGIETHRRLLATPD